MTSYILMVMLNRLFDYLLTVQLDIRFSAVSIEGDNLCINTPPHKVMRLFSLLFWGPLILMTWPLWRDVSFAYWVVWFIVAPILLFMGLLFATTSYLRSFNRRSRVTLSEVTTAFGRKEASFPFEFSPQAAILTTRWAHSGKAKSIQYMVRTPGVIASQYVIYNDYEGALAFASLWNHFFEVTLDDQTQQQH